LTQLRNCSDTKHWGAQFLEKLIQKCLHIDETVNCFLCCKLHVLPSVLWQYWFGVSQEQWRRSKFILRGWNFFPHREGVEASVQWPKPEGSRSEVRFLGRGSQPPPHKVEGLGERYKLPQWGLGWTPKNFEFGATWDLKIHYRNAL